MYFTRRIKPLVLCVVLSFWVLGCGIRLGGVTVANDAAPTGNVTIVATGSLATLNSSAHPSVTISGSVKIYRDFDNGIHWVRIENLGAPNEAGMLVIVTAGGSTVLSTGLKGTQGNLTYSTTIPSSDTRTWTSLKIQSTTWADPITRDYGEALLQ